MASYDDHLKVGSNHGDLTVGQLRKRLVTARAHSQAVGRLAKTEIASIFSLSLPRIQRICATVKLDLDV